MQVCVVFFVCLCCEVGLEELIFDVLDGVDVRVVVEYFE